MTTHIHEPHRSIRVVLAEDQAMVQGALAVLLSIEPDIEVAAVASDGEAALRAVAQQVPNVLVTDIEMPKLPVLSLPPAFAKLTRKRVSSSSPLSPGPAIFAALLKQEPSATSSKSVLR